MGSQAHSKVPGGSYSQSGKPNKSKCLKNQYGLKKLMNQEVELQYCFEHAGRTCCNQNDILPIRNKMAGVRKLSSPAVSGECFALTSRVFCSHCDADVGIGNIPQETIC